MLSEFARRFGARVRTVKLTGEATGQATIAGAARRTASEIAAQLHEAAQKQGWIS